MDSFCAYDLQSQQTRTELLRTYIAWCLSIGEACGGLGLGAVAANGSAKETPHDSPSPTSSPAAGTDHPECYDERKLHDPADFCYPSQPPLRTAFQGLRRQDQEILALCVLEEFSMADACQVRDIPVGTVKSRLSRAKAKLAEKITPSPTMRTL